MRDEPSHDETATTAECCNDVVVVGVVAPGAVAAASNGYHPMIFLAIHGVSRDFVGKHGVLRLQASH